MRIKLLIFVVLLFPSICFGGTYYIDWNASNDSDNGTSTSTPWKRCPGMPGFSGSYTHANGDIFVFKGGVTWPYISGDAILVLAYSGADGTEDIYTGGNNPSYNWGSGNAIFDGGNTDAPSYLIEAYRSNFKIRYLTLQNLRHTDASGSAIFISGGNFEIDHNYISPNSVNALAWSVDTGTYSKIYVHDNTIRQSGRVHFSAGDSRTTDIQFYNNTFEGAWDYNPLSYHTDGLMFGGDGTTDYAIKNLKIYNNKFWGDWQQGATAQIYLNGTSMSCYNFTDGASSPTINGVAYVSGQDKDDTDYEIKIYTATLTSGAWDGSGVGTVCGSNGTLVNGNILKDYYSDAIRLTLSSSASASTLKSTQNTLIYNNLLLTSNESGSGGAADKGIVAAAGHDGLGIYNNTIDHTSLSILGSMCMQYYYGMSNVTIKNNICRGFADASINFQGTISGTHVIDNNIYVTDNNRLIWDNSDAYTTCSAASTGLGSVFPNTYCSILDSDIKFTTDITPADNDSGSYSINNGNLMIQSSSYAVGHGANLNTIFTTDYAGTTRGTTWDIGAYEYTAGGDTTAPSVTISTSDPQTITSDSLSVTGTASDAVGVDSCKYRIGSAPDATHGTACTGTTSWSCTTSGYSIGANTLYVGCVDAAGNWGSDSITVNYSSGTPVLTGGTLTGGTISN
jgi:hypothetical protein